jgi:GMP synthase-like glutamine amidotransferase
VARDREERPRTGLLYVLIDRPENAGEKDHADNLAGLARIVASLDAGVTITTVTVADLIGINAAAIDEAFRPLAVLSGGSFTEWFEYGRDPVWRQQLDGYMSFLRTTTTPLLAICGSHQLVAAAFHGFGAIAHMVDEGEPIRILDELSAKIPRGLWPDPRVGEEGTYPLRATAAGATDPLVQSISLTPMASSHHKDMVIDTRGFALLYRGDEDRLPATRAPDQARQRCVVQAMKHASPSRLLYSCQFHPEIRAFEESTRDDGGFGQQWIMGFLSLARRWWLDHPDCPSPAGHDGGVR